IAGGTLLLYDLSADVHIDPYKPSPIRKDNVLASGSGKHEISSAQCNRHEDSNHYDHTVDRQAQTILFKESHDAYLDDYHRDCYFSYDNRQDMHRQGPKQNF